MARPSDASSASAQCRFVETGDAVEHGGFTGAVRPDQGGDLAPLASNDRSLTAYDAAETHRQMIDGENAFSRSSMHLFDEVG